MRKILFTCLLISTFLILGCGSKDDANGNRGANSNRDASNQSATNTNAANSGSPDHNSMNHNSMNMNANANATPANPDEMMNHDMQSAPNAANAPYDLQFLDTMIAHHQAAVVMSKPALEKASRAEVKNLAQNIIRSQTKEIEQMQAWREQWFKNQPPALNMEATGMKESMQSMDMKKLGSATGNDFDLAFIEMMIPHHQGALLMAKEALDKSQHPELKTLAQTIIMAQETEIDTMQKWKDAWSKK